MATVIETSYDSSENELLDKSLSVWRGSTSFDSEEDFLPVDVDLHTAASLGQFDCVRNYLKSGKTVANRKNLGGWTPLMYAAYIGHDNIIHLLLDLGVDVETRNPKGQTSLMLAACCGNESVAYFLLSAGSDLEACDERGWTALFHATYAGHQNVVGFLLENGANMEVREPRRGMTPFMQAALEGHEIIAQDFLQHGVDVEAKSHSGDTARSMAIYVGHTKIVTLIDNACNTQRRARRNRALESGTNEDGSRQLKGPSILDGPTAFARLRDKTPSGGGDGKLANGGSGSPETLRSHEMTSPIREGDRSDSWSSGRSHDADDEDDNDVFSQTGKLTIRSSSSSSSSLAAALAVDGLSHDLKESIGDGQSVEFPRSLEKLLDELGLCKYMSVFNEQDVDLQVFLSLTDNDLKEVGIKLFGPRRKMTNAIARWHSEISTSTCARNRLEQAYADKLEAEMQELAIQLHKAVDQADKMRGELLQERELRSVAEACLMEAWQHVRNLATDTKQQCSTVTELTRRTKFCLRELLSRRQQFSTMDTLAANGLSERLNLENAGASDVTAMTDENVIRFLDQMVDKMATCVQRVGGNTEKLLGKDDNFQDSFGRVT